MVVRGAHGFGLKELANAMQGLGLIDAQWRDGPADGRGAMVGAWWCETQAAEHAQVLLDFDLMREIRAYNEVDCRAMMEIVRYLRAHH